MDYFLLLGFVPPPHENPADFFLDTISGEAGEATGNWAILIMRVHSGGPCQPGNPQPRAPLTPPRNGAVLIVRVLAFRLEGLPSWDCPARQCQ